MKAILARQLRGRHAWFFHLALDAPTAVVLERSRVFPPPGVEPVEFVALALSRYVELGGQPPNTAIDPDRLRNDLECEYVAHNVREGVVYLIELPRAKPIVFISEQGYRALVGELGAHEFVAT